MALQITLQSLEIGKRALRWDKAKLHQSAGGVIDEHQKRAGRRPIFERTPRSDPTSPAAKPPLASMSSSSLKFGLLGFCFKVEPSPQQNQWLSFVSSNNQPPIAVGLTTAAA